MSIALVVNGNTYNYPQAHETAGWGDAATNWASAVTDGLVPKIGGSFTLTGDVNFGPDYGFLLKYLTSSSTHPASSGTLRLANSDYVVWRNNANDGDVSLSVNTNNNLAFGGELIVLNNDTRFAPSNVIVVQKNPGFGQYSSIKAAVDYIIANGSPSESNSWAVKVYPGTYTEDQIDMAAGICVSGLQEDSVIVVASDPTNIVYNMATYSAVENMIVSGASGTGGIAFNIVDIIPVFIRNVKVFNNETDFYIESTGTSVVPLVFAIIENIEFQPVFLTATVRKYGVRVIGSGGIANITLKNHNVTGRVYEAAYDVTGSLATIQLENIIIDGTENDSLAYGTGFRISDGAKVRGAASVRLYQTGLEVLNVGSAPTVVLNLGIIDSVVDDVNIQHPGTMGSIVGYMDRSKVVVDSSAPVSVSFSGVSSTSAGFTSTGPLYIGSTFDDITNITDLIQQSTSVGLLSGGTVTSTVTPLQINIAAGYGYVEDATSGKAKRVEWASTNLSLTDNTFNMVVYIDNSGAPSFATTAQDTYRTILLGYVSTSSGAVAGIAPVPQNAKFLSTGLDYYLRKALGPIYGSGSIVTENTSTARALDVSAGSYWYSKQLITPSGGTAVPLTWIGHSGGYPAGGSIAVVDNTQYDDGSDLQPLSTGYYTKHEIWASGEGAYESYLMVYGTAQYATLLEAQQAPVPAEPSFFSQTTVPIAAVIVKEGQSAIAQIFDIRPRIGFQNPSASATSYHGNLLGLDADDHHQYLLTNGGRTLTGNLDLGTNNIINIGTANGVTIEAHASRHLPNGADPITTAAPTTSLSNSTTNAEGIQNSLSRSDHSHAITGFQVLDADLTAIAALSSTGIAVRTASDTWNLRTVTGTTDRISVTNGSGVAGNPTLDIASTYVGQTSITTLGTITTGVWNGTSIDLANYVTGILPSTSFPALTGDVTTSSGSIATTLATVNSNVGSFGSASSVSTFTVNGKGLITAASNTSIVIAESQVTNLVTDLSNKQPLDATLTALAAYNTNGIVTQTAADTFTGRTITGTTDRISVTNGSGVAGNPTLDIASTYVGQTSITTLGTITTGVWNGTTLGVAYGGTNISSYTIGDIVYASGTTALSKLAAGATNTAIVSNGTGVAPSYQAIVNSVAGTSNQVIVSSSTGAVTLSLPQSIDTSSTPTFAQLTISNAPSSATDGVNKNYVDNLLAGLSWKISVAAASTANLSVTYNNGSSGVGATLTNNGTQAAFAIDGYTASLNDRILIKDQTNKIQNGLFILTTVGSGSTNWVLTRSTDADTPTELLNATTLVQNGAVNADTGWTQTATSITIGTTNLSFAQSSGAGTYTAGTGLLLTGNQFSNTGVLSLAGTSNRLTVSASTGSITADIAATYVGQTSITTLGTITTGTWNGSLVTGTYGGTGVNNGANTITLAGNLVTSGANSLTLTTTGSTNVTLPTTGTLVNNAVTTLSSLASIGTIATGVWNGTKISEIYGGTNQTTYITGDLLYASATNTLSKLADVATGNALISGGVGVAMSWGKIGLTTHVSGVLPTANGGTNLNSYTTGDLLYASATNTLSKLPISTNGYILFIESGVPSWDATTNITTLGTITTGVWNGTAIDLANYSTGILPSTSFPALTGDITTVSGAVATTLATVNSNVGSFGSASSVGTFTVNGKGLITAVSSISIAIAESQVTNLVTDLSNKQPLDSTLTALAAYNTNGILTQTAADTFIGRTITGTTNTITVTNGSGVSGNPTITIADNAVMPGTASVTLPIGTSAQRPGSPTDGMLRYNSDEEILEGYTAPYSTTASPVAFQRTILYRKRKWLSDEFIKLTTTVNGVNVLGDLGWTQTSAGTSSNSIQPSVTDHIGILRIGTGTTAANQARIHLGLLSSSAFIAANQVEYFSYLIRIPVITTVIYNIGIGQDTSVGGMGTDSVYFTFDTTGANATFQFITRAASTSATAVNTVTVAANTWYLLEAFYNGSSWTPAVNGTAYTAQTTNIPTAVVNVGATIATQTTATRQLDLDAFYMITRELGNRY